MIEMKEWDGFEGRLWKEEINVRQFIQDNYTPYDGDESFLADPTAVGCTPEITERGACQGRSS